MEFQYEPNRIFMTDENGVLRAEIEFPDTDDNVFTITHTFVDDSLRGQGIAEKLTETVIKQAEKTGKKIRPFVCRALVRPPSRIRLHFGLIFSQKAKPPFLFKRQTARVAYFLQSLLERLRA